MQSDFSPFSFRFWSNSWQVKFFFVGIVVGIIIVVAVLLISRGGVFKTPPSASQRENQPLTDEQKIQTLKNLSGNSSVQQPSDQQKIQTLQQSSQPHPSMPQPSDADKLKALQQLNGR